jgi:hypothetical protein
VTGGLDDRPAAPLAVGSRVHLQEVEGPGAPRGAVGRLTAVDDGRLAITLLDPIGPSDLQPTAAVRLSCAMEEGLYTANTEVVSREGDDLVLEVPSTSRQVQRRRHRRVPVRLSLQCRRLEDTTHGAFEVMALDLSEGGVRMATPEGLVVGDVVRLTIDDDADTIDFRGLVVDVRQSSDHPGTHDVRVAFSGFNEGMQSALGKLLARHTPGTN